MPHALAASLVYGHGGAEAFSTEALDDERVARLRHRVDMRLVAQELPWPHDRPAFLTLQGTDGRSYSAQCMSARGGPERPFDDEDLWAKIQALSHASAPGLTSTLRRLHADCAASATAAALSRSWRALVDQFFTPAV
jgi:2-methylcitrate dehydratase PrpD